MQHTSPCINVARNLFLAMYLLLRQYISEDKASFEQEPPQLIETYHEHRQANAHMQRLLDECLKTSPEASYDDSDAGHFYAYGVESTVNWWVISQSQAPRSSE